MLELDQVAPSDVINPNAAQVSGAPAKFAALRNADCRPYLFGAALAMMADNIEHVITYWVLWQKFHSPALAGFEVISHWVPFLSCSGRSSPGTCATTGRGRPGSGCWARCGCYATSGPITPWSP